MGFGGRPSRICGGEGRDGEPTDWALYPGDPNLNKYAEGKVGDFINGAGFAGSSYLKLRNTTELNDKRIGTRAIEFLRTTENEAYGSMDCGDWRVGTNDECGFDFHPKQTDESGFETNIGLGFRVIDGNESEWRCLCYEKRGVEGKRR